jgi:hypothetical protein
MELLSGTISVLARFFYGVFSGSFIISFFNGLFLNFKIAPKAVKMKDFLLSRDHHRTQKTNNPCSIFFRKTFVVAIIIFKFKQLLALTRT